MPRPLPRSGLQAFGPAVAAVGVLLAAGPATAHFFDVPAFEAGSPTFAASLQEVDVAPAPDGGFALVWGEFGSTLGAGNRIVTRRFSRSGVAAGPPVRVDTSGYGLYPTLHADRSGGFVGAWMWSHNGSPRALYTRRLGGSAAGVGSEVRVDNPDTGPMVGHDVAYRTAGPVYAFQQNGLFLRAYDTAGAALTASIEVADFASAFDVAVAPLPDGGVAVAWNNHFSEDRSFIRFYDSALAPRGPAQVLDHEGEVQELVAGSDGVLSAVGFAWYSDTTTDPGGPRSDVWMRRLDGNGAPLGARQVVRSAHAGMNFKVDAATDSRGNTVVAWREYDMDTETLHPGRARAYGPDGEAVGSDFEATPGPAADLRVAALVDDCFALAWYRSARTWASVACLCDGSGCGNGQHDATCEACDDGNAADGDGCDGNCTLSACGNGVVSSGEGCDDGNTADGDGCDHDCTPTACGNGIVTAGEQCDDGNAADSDGCDHDCRPSGCGNGRADDGEDCDDGNATNGDGCDADCSASGCGNGIAAGAEACDDGNAAAGDGCDPNCTIPACGNQVAAGDEECDDGNRAGGDGCDANCLVEACGNGRVESAEACDPALAPAEGAGACNPDCTLRAVHDSVVLAVEPVEVAIPVGNDPFRVNVVVQVVNADVDPVREEPGHAIRLIAADGDCPAGTVTAQGDFDRGAPGVQDTTVVGGGLPATAIAEVTVSREAFAPFDRGVPTRCTLWFTAVEATGASDDPTPDNNVVAVALDVSDSEDQPRQGEDEFFVASMAPVLVKVPAGQAAVTRQIKPSVRRSRDLPVDAPDVEVTITAGDGDCPAGTVGLVDMDRRAAGHQARLMLRRGRRARGSLGLIVRADRFTSPGMDSPRRCTALITATGVGDTDPSNNTTRLVVDVVDRNDFQQR